MSNLLFSIHVLACLFAGSLGMGIGPDQVGPQIKKSYSRPSFLLGFSKRNKPNVSSLTSNSSPQGLSLFFAFSFSFGIFYFQKLSGKGVMEKLDEIEAIVGKLKALTGIALRPEEKHHLDTITSDFDVEALSSSFLKALEELDIYLQSLVEPATTIYDRLTHDIEELESNLREKEILMDKAKALLEEQENSYRELKKKQYKTVYNK